MGDAWQKFKRDLKIIGALMLVLSVLGIIGAAFAFSTPTHNFTDDGFTVAQTQDGANITVLYEVDATYRGEMETKDRYEAMQEMNKVQVCANGHIDNYIESHNRSEVLDANLNELTEPCETDNTELTVRNLNTKFTEEA